jgi:signal transduction histidine kinase
VTQRITPYLGAVGWLALVAAIGWLDHSTSPAYGFGFFYLLAILPAAWIHGRSVGLIVALAATVAWFISDQAADPTAPIGAVVWNSLSRGFLFCAGAVLVDRMRRDRSRLVASESERARFLRVIERELPRPAGTLSVAIERLQREGVLSGAAYEELRRDAERVQFLARDFVTLGQLQSERLTLSREPVDLRTLITDLVQQRPERTRIFANIQEGQSFKISADAARVSQAFTAILDEAAQASDEDIRIDADRHATSVKVAISVGVARNDTTLRPAEDDERVVGFELARLVCEAHGGSFALFRRPVSRGLRAVVTLPRVRLVARGRGAPLLPVR